MTIENFLSYPMMTAIPDVNTAAFALSMQQTQVRTRNHSGGSTGSQGSASSYGSDKCTSLPAQDLLAYQLARMGVTAVPQPRQLQTPVKRPVDRTQTSTTGPKNINTARYKTEMCRPFEESGHCKYGDKCQFAHGIHEMKNLSRHPKYKTELCRTYHTVGFCPYGPRCHFVHNEDEGKLGEINKMKHEQVLKQVAQQVAQQQQRVMSQFVPQPKAMPVPVPMTRPDMMPLSLRSSVDSSTTSSSPASLSPTSMLSDDVFTVSPPPGFAPLPAHQPPTNLFSFPDFAPPAASSRSSSLCDPLSSLTAGLQAATPRSASREDLFTAPPTPPLSVDSDQSWSSESPDAKSPLRLPIFNSLASFTEIK